jgi:hypothetical protein
MREIWRLIVDHAVRRIEVFYRKEGSLKTLPHGFYQAVVESVWPKDGAYGEYWEWRFTVDGQRSPLKAFTSGNLKNQRTRSFVEAVLDRSVDPTEELYASHFGGEHCTVQVGTTIKNGREYSTIEKVL